PQRDQKTPERHVIGDIGMADRAEIDGIIEPQPLEPVFGHHLAGLGVARAAPVELAPSKTETIGARRRLHRRNPLRHHLMPDAVAGDYRDPITLRHAIPPLIAAA